MTNNAIEIKELKKIYDNKFEALRKINLNIPKGSFYGLLGPNGAGKTTTIGAISGLVNYKHGNINILGFDNKKDFRITRKLIGLSQVSLLAGFGMGGTYWYGVKPELGTISCD